MLEQLEHQAAGIATPADYIDILMISVEEDDRARLNRSKQASFVVSWAGTIVHLTDDSVLIGRNVVAIEYSNGLTPVE